MAKGLTGLGQDHPPVFAAKQGRLQKRLKLGQGAAQRGLRQTLLAGDRRQAALGGNGQKGADVAQLDAWMHNHIAIQTRPICITPAHDRPLWYGRKDTPCTSCHCPTPSRTQTSPGHKTPRLWEAVLPLSPQGLGYPL